jgi:hypothetical protein
VGRDRWPGDAIALDVRCAQQIYLPCTFFCCEFIDNNELMHPRELNNRKQIIYGTLLSVISSASSEGGGHFGADDNEVIVEGHELRS